MAACGRRLVALALGALVLALALPQYVVWTRDEPRDDEMLCVSLYHVFYLYKYCWCDGGVLVETLCRAAEDAFGFTSWGDVLQDHGSQQLVYGLVWGGALLSAVVALFSCKDAMGLRALAAAIVAGASAGILFALPPAIDSDTDGRCSGMCDSLFGSDHFLTTSVWWRPSVGWWALLVASALLLGAFAVGMCARRRRRRATVTVLPAHGSVYYVDHSGARAEPVAAGARTTAHSEYSSTLPAMTVRDGTGADSGRGSAADLPTLPPRAGPGAAYSDASAPYQAPPPYNPTAYNSR